MKTIKEMNGSELRVFLGIESVVDKGIETFDKWDNSHMGRDYQSATEQRKYLIDKLTEAAFCGTDDEKIGVIYEAVKDKEDAEALAKELVTFETYAPLWDSINENMSINTEGYNGIDAYVEASQLEFSANLHGGYADEEEIQKLFNE